MKDANGYRYYPERGVYEFTAAAISELVRRVAMTKEQAAAEDAEENHRRRLELIEARGKEAIAVEKE